MFEVSPSSNPAFLGGGQSFLSTHVAYKILGVQVSNWMEISSSMSVINALKKKVETTK